MSAGGDGAGSAPSIRRRLYASVLAWLVPVFALSGVGTYAFVRSALTREFDAKLMGKGRALASGARLESHGGEEKVEFEYSDESLPEFGRKRHPHYFEIWELDGAGTRHGVARSPSLGEGHLQPPAKPGKSGVAWDVTLPDGEAGRAGCASVSLGDDDDDEGRAPTTKKGPSATLVVMTAEPREAIDEPLRAVLAGCAGVAVLAAAATVAAVYAGVRRGLGPLDVLAGEVSLLDPEALPERPAFSPVPAEATPIVRALGLLVGRVQETVARERSFAGAAAHELRTPIAETRALLEVRRKWPVSVEKCVETLGQALEANERMEKLCEMLLDLAKQRGATSAPRERVELGPLVGELVERSRGAALARGVIFDVDTAPGVAVRAERAGIECVLRNLVENAADHADPTSRVEVRVEAVRVEGLPEASVTVRNRASNLTQDDVGRLVEPLWRGDAARSSGAPGKHHAGLGLAIAAAIAERQGIRLSFVLQGDQLVARVDENRGRR